MDLNPSSCWNSILEKVKPHIPTIDFDSLASENEEIVTIYQRPAGLSLKVLEDFDSFSVEDAELEKLLKPVAQTSWSEETCDSLSLKLYDDKIAENKTAVQWDTGGSDADAEAGACQSNTVEFNRAKLETSVKPHLDSLKSDTDFAVLSFARLDQWDLDSVLQNLKEDGLSLQQHVSVDTHANGDKYSPQQNVMEKLVTYCKSQSSKSASEPGKSPNIIRQNNVWSKSLERMAEIPSYQEYPTVYIDLRCPDPSIIPPRTSPNLSSQSRSPAKYHTHGEAPPAKIHNLKVHTGSWMEDREVTGKSVLLQKIRKMNQNGNKYSNNYIDPSESVLGNEAEELKDKPPQPVESACSYDSQHVWVDKQSSPIQSDSREPKTEIPPTVQQTSVKEPKQQSDQQRQQRKQTLQREQQQILKRLEIHCPTKSVYQKQSAAERTDVLYDFEASHLQSVNTLPEDIKSKASMLLTVNLSCPGMVGDRVHGKRNPPATKAHIYNTLVAWFMSLVGPDTLDDEEAEGAGKVPFWVAGLQQLWTENGLVLHVLAVAHHCYKPRKWDIDIHAPFYSHVCRFLSETSLTQIAPWLPELQILLNQQAYASPIHLPSSCLNCFISATFNKKVIDRTFGLTPGFYWQTMETQERVCKRRETTQALHTEVSVALGFSGFFLHPLITHYTLQLVIDSGLDVCGLRLLYPPHRLLSDSAGGVPVNQRADETCQPVLALAVRGSYAHSLLKDITSSFDTFLPKETNPTSVSRSQEPPMVYSPQLASQVHRELCLWFSGRLQGGSAQSHSQPLNRVVPSDDRVGGSLFSLSRSSAFLCATTKADILFVASPVVSPCCYGQVLAVCERRGFSLLGLQTLQLQRNGAPALGLTNQQTNVFCSPPTVTLDQEVDLPSQCLVLILRKENAMHHSVSLPAALMREFKAQKLVGCLHSRLNGVDTVEPSFCFHTVPYSRNLFHIFVRSMWTVPDPPGVILPHHKCLSNSEMEQVVILTLCGKDMSQGLSLLHRVLTEGPEGDAQHAHFKLLGLKWLPVLTRLQAQELSPYEVGEQLYRCSQDNLMSSPALVCALRRMDAFASLKKLLPHDYPGNLSVLMSPTPEVAFRQASLFFFDHELISDPQMLLTVCLFKPRVWNHALTEIFHKLQQSGLMLVGLRVLTLGRSDATSLLSSESEPSDLDAHVECLCSGSSLALCLQGENAVRRLLDVLGQEDSSLWTDCYGSGSYQKAVEDVKRLFPDGLCCSETSTMRQEQILSMCSDPLASVEREQSCTLDAVAQETLSPSNASGTRRGSLIHSPLWQTTCLLIPLDAPLLGQVRSQLEMLEQLLRSGCHLVAGRMCMLDNKQRKHIAETLKVSSSGSERMTHLYTAPCLIMALQGEKIVTAFNLLLESIYKDRPDLENVEEMIIYPGSEKQAKQLICYLFDALCPESCYAIVP
ncbi:dynein axonemal assembly factor 8 [Seriola aureovittata]|uniref:dynein axonemal assembly factor 8 n=1 Tax=Seriola aureovittata TaxID=2871759 RepID=UPI0024BEC118|nr:dynein axonemal assembly factor 8 [Seriola aureovittata]